MAEPGQTQGVGATTAKGASAGAALGSVIGPWGTVIGGAVGAIGGLTAGLINRKKAESLLPPSENVMERSMLNTIRRRRRALETGTASTADRAAVKQMAKTFGANSFKYGGPVNTGMLAQLMTQGMSNISAQYAPQYTQLLGQEGEQVKSMANLSNDLALLRSARTSATGENQAKYGQQNLAALMGMIPNKAPGDTSQPTTNAGQGPIA
jgi:hypothetical protein